MSSSHLTVLWAPVFPLLDILLYRYDQGARNGVCGSYFSRTPLCILAAVFFFYRSISHHISYHNIEQSTSNQNYEVPEEMLYHTSKYVLLYRTGTGRPIMMREIRLERRVRLLVLHIRRVLDSTGYCYKEATVQQR